nr:hypothetical protein [Tanacetum cinerariifolium]
MVTVYAGCLLHLCWLHESFVLVIERFLLALSLIVSAVKHFCWLEYIMDSISLRQISDRILVSLVLWEEGGLKTATDLRDLTAGFGTRAHGDVEVKYGKRFGTVGVQGVILFISSETTQLRVQRRRLYLDNHVGNKMHKAFPLPCIEFPLVEEVPTASEEGCHCQKKRESIARKIALLSKSRRNCQSKSNDNFTKTESNNECIEILKKKLETLKQENEGVDGKLTGLLTASKDLDNLIESQRADKNKEGLGYSVVPPPPAQIYSSPKKDFSWTGLPEFADDTLTDYSRTAPTVESSLDDAQNRKPSITVTEASPSTISPKPFIKFVKAVDRSAERPTINKVKTAKKPSVKGEKGENMSNVYSQEHATQTSYSQIIQTTNETNEKRTSFHKPTHSYNKRPFQENTQDLMIILIQKVQRLKRELKARTPVHKVDRGRSRPVMAWVPKKV